MSAAQGRNLSLAAESSDLVEAVVRFCRLLRTWGVHLTASASQSALEALREIDVTRREDFRSALRIAIVQRPEDFPLFTYLFNAYWRHDEWRRHGPSNRDLANRPVDSHKLGRDVEDADERVREAGFRPVGRMLGPGRDVGERDEAQQSRAAPVGARAARRSGSGAERAELERLARALSQQLAHWPSRRHEPARAGSRPDPRAMLRRSLRAGGIPVEMRWRRRRVQRTRLVLFVDVSRSMDEYATLFLEFAATVLQRVWRVEVFLFASELARVTDVWLDQRWEELRNLVPDCGGGTQTGTCLQQFLRDHEHCLRGGGSIVMILSDGLDAGDPASIATTLERLRRRSRGVIWLNPLLAVPGYEPRAQGMAAALPHVDVFAPAHDLASLWRVVASIRDLVTGRAGLQHSEHGARTVA
jgi:uncharacterized protein with von Willebrand factor type A (vWA) domain